VFIDESGFDRPGLYRKKGWAPKGITPVQKARFERGPRVQLIAAYTQRGIKLCRFFSGSMDRPLFEDFIEQLLCHCSRWPEPETVLIMDNGGFHYSERVRQMVEEAGVLLDFTPPYTPRTDPIEEFFGEVKNEVTAQELQRADSEGFRDICEVVCRGSR
jgi:transposase